MKRLLLSALLVCGLLLTQVALAGAAPRPGLDRSYGSQGVADIGAHGEEARTEAWAAFADGATVVVRSKWECAGSAGSYRCTRSLTMRRYGPKGEFDQSFGAGAGAVTLAQGLTTPIRSGLAVDSQGRILASWGTAAGTTVARFDAAGAPDPSFGSGGQVSLGCACGEGEGSAGVLLLPDGKLLLHRVSRVSQGSGTDTLTLWRLFPGGGLDPSFGDGAPEGVSVGFNFGAAPRFFAAAPNGSVILAGGPGCCEENRFSYVYRLSRKGRLVRGFAANAAHSLQGLPGKGEARMSSLVVRRGGKIDVFGSHREGGFVFRLRADGRRERHFGKRGLRRLAWPVGVAAGDAGGGTFVVNRDPVRDGLVAHRLFPSGRVDPRFGGTAGVSAFGVPIHNELEAVTLPRGRALVFVGGYPECRYGGCEQQPRLVMFQEPPLRKRGGHA